MVSSTLNCHVKLKSFSESTEHEQGLGQAERRTERRSTWIRRLCCCRAQHCFPPQAHSKLCLRGDVCRIVHAKWSRAARGRVRMRRRATGMSVSVQGPAGKAAFRCRTGWCRLGAAPRALLVQQSPAESSRPTGRPTRARAPARVDGSRTWTTTGADVPERCLRRLKGREMRPKGAQYSYL